MLGRKADATVSLSLTLEEPASARSVRVPRAYAPRFPHPPGPIPRRPPGRRALRAGARPRRGRPPSPPWGIERPLRGSSGSRHGFGESTAATRSSGLPRTQLAGLSVGQGYNSATREPPALPGLRPAGACGPTLWRLLFARLWTMGPIPSHPCGLFVPGPESESCVAPPLRVPAAAKDCRFVCEDTRGLVGSLRPPGDSLPWGRRSSRFGPVTQRSARENQTGPEPGPTGTRALHQVIAAGSGL